VDAIEQKPSGGLPVQPDRRLILEECTLFLDFVLRNALVRANLCTRPTWTDRYRLERRTVPDYNLIYPVSGRVVWTVAGEPIPLAPGDLAVVPPHVPHHAESQSRAGALCSVHVEVTLPGGQDVFALLEPAQVRHVVRDSPLARYLRGRRSFRRDRRADIRVRGSVLFQPDFQAAVRSQPGPLPRRVHIIHPQVQPFH
jgi:hypothetical protein